MSAGRTFSLAAPILFVGSDYIGDPRIDQSELHELAPDLLVDLETIGNAAANREAVAVWATRYRTRHEARLEARVVLEADRAGKVVVGVSSVHRLFRELPEMPIKDTLGCDYCQRHLLHDLNWPIVYHNRAVDHRHTSDRDTRSDWYEFVDYHCRDARRRILLRVWSRHTRQGEAAGEHKSGDADAIVDGAAYVRGWRAALTAYSPEELMLIPHQMSTVFSRAARLAGPTAGRKFDALATVLARRARDFVNEVAAGIDDYAFLVERWPVLIAAAGAIGYDDDPPR